MKFVTVYHLDFNMFYDASIWSLQQNLLPSSSGEWQGALAVAYGVWRSLGPHWPATPKEVTLS